MNIALWAGFITSLLLISNIDGGRVRYGGKIHSRPLTHHYSSHHNTYHAAPPSPVVVVPSNGGYQKPGFKSSLASGFGQGVGFGVGQQAVKSVFGDSSGSSQTVNHVYTNQAAPAVLAPSSGHSVTVVQTEEKKEFPVIYIIIIVIGCIVASSVLFLLIKLLMN
ncbi:uncharacterized protein LOC123268287 [Cotesia glomerata]|uniref:Uncharacterized protein n=1 Tax=Cotesia glomerata TaxID=32391 RepID=A0AAV7J809_COTGL|nr:uncharacterized protein LOC123268287 [Cotesia glomerata]KAH0568980.1 hypothetical protein KQX54_021679 [Cotesia glomerata]